MPDCGHPLCERIGGPCSLATGRSRGCTPGLGPRAVEPEVFDEIRALLPLVETDAESARRLAEIIRREARNDRNVIALARDEEPDLAPALERLCLRRR